MKKFGLLLVFATSLSCFGQLARPTVYIEPQQGFETYLAAAIAKKNVPVDVVADEAKATYVLKAAPVEIKTESTGETRALSVRFLCWDRGQGERFRSIHRDELEQNAMGLLSEQAKRRWEERAINGGGSCQALKGVCRSQFREGSLGHRGLGD